MEIIWIYAVRVAGLIIGLSPFVRNLMFMWGMSDDKYPLTLSDGIFIVVGFIFVWGSSHFGSWANQLGASIVDKVNKK